MEGAWVERKLKVDRINLNDFILLLLDKEIKGLLVFYPINNIIV
jgi:hypothetical protein